MAEQARADHSTLVGGRYRLEHILGEGGMGAVHLATDVATGQEVALKRLHADAANDTRRGLFEREFHTLASLRHPRIVAVHEFGADAGGAYYTMERLEGNDLSRAAPMPWREACSCLRDVASIIGVLHSRKLVHRDLSPRNLWRTPDGRLKLLDFGALSPFGVPTEVVGTAPLTAPEALRREPLDARTDLFALGALGYWLLTGTHAFAARHMAQLPSVWQHEPVAPSQVARLSGGDDQNLPPELDALVLTLLRLDPNERPRGTMEVIDTLNAVAQLAPEAEEVVHRGYLDSNAFVGRHEARAQFEAVLERAQGGKPGVLWVEAPRGQGRSRLLSELSLLARLSGATVLSPGAQGSGQPYGLAIELSRALLTAMPEAAREAAAPYEAALGDLLPALRKSGERPQSPAVKDAAAQRAQRLDALTGWLRDVARSRTLVVVVDDLHEADEPSQSLLSTLAAEEGPHRLAIVVSAPARQVTEGVTALGMLRRHAQRARLGPLSEREVRALLASCFGEVSNLLRLSARLHRLTRGCPGHVLLIARHLVQEGSIQYAEGTWVLPFDLPAALPESLDEGALALLGESSEPARQLARYLALPDVGWVPPSVLRRLPGLGDPEAWQAALAELTAAGLVRATPEGLRLGHENLAEPLRSEWTTEQRKALHGQLARHFEALRAEDASGELRVGLQWLHAGELDRARLPLLQALRASLSGNHMAQLRACAPGFEQAHRLLRAQGASEEAMTPTLVGLSVAGFLVDGAYAMRFGDETRRALDRTLRMGIARGLRRFVGRKPALILTLLWTGLALKLRRSPVRLGELVRWYVSVLSSLAGVAATYVDPKAIHRYSEALEPFAALGAEHVAGFTYRYTLGIAMISEDSPSRALAVLDGCLERLRSEAPITGLNQSSRDFMIGGILYATGARANFAVRESTLAMADELETLSAIHAMQAEYVRAGYHLFRGQMEQAAAHRRKLERLAIQLGSGWQAEATAPTQDLLAGLLTLDASLVKRAAQQMQHVAAYSQAVGEFQRYAQGAYHLLRRRYERAVAILGETDDEPRGVSGWARWRGLLAAAYNGLGDHDKARQVCESALDAMDPEDLDYVVFTLDLQVELARARAGLGDGAEAGRQLDALLERFADRGPLIRSYLHRARARLAFELDERETCTWHIDAMETAVAPLRIPSLHGEIASLRRALRGARHPEGGEPLDAFSDEEAQLSSRMRTLMSCSGQELSERVATGLQLVSEVCQPVGCALLLRHEQAPLATRGDVLPTEVLSWACDRLAACADEDDTQTDDDLTTAANPDGFAHAGVQYGLCLLWQPGSLEPVGGLVLAFEGSDFRLPPDALRRLLAGQLRDEP